MSRLERNYRPLTEASGKPLEITNRHGHVVREVLVDFSSVPHVENDQSNNVLGEGIGVNLRGLNRRAGISQIGNLEITTGTIELKERSHDHDIIRRSWAGQRGKDGAPTTILDKIGNDLRIHINTEEIGNRLHEREVDEHPKTWAHELNQAIELAFLRHQMDQLIKAPNTILAAGPHMIEGVQAVLGQYSGVAHGLTELGINLGVMALHLQAPVKHTIQSFPLERTLINGIVSGKDVALGLHSLIRPLPQKDK